MEIRILAIFALFACAFVAALPNAGHKLPKEEIPLDNLQSSPDEVEGSGQEVEPLNKRIEAPRLEVPE
jgi:hypothetical protein